MINRITDRFPEHQIVESEAENLYIIDHKKDDGGKVEIHSEPQISNAVQLYNPNKTPIYFDGFPDNAFQISPGAHLKQCECIVFPQTCMDDDWILVIETKYSANIETAFDEEIDYPNGMIDQVANTVAYLRDQNIIPKDKMVNALVSFPNLIDDFSAFFFSGTPSVEDVLIEHKIKIRASNVATIRNRRNIYIGELRQFGTKA
jgi:hypothetical protein